MLLREQFEKETGNAHITEALGRYNPVYVDWLESQLTNQSDRIRELEQMRHEVDMRLPGLRNRLQCYHDGTYGRSVVKMHVELKMVSDIEQALNKTEKLSNA